MFLPLNFDVTWPPRPKSWLLWILVLGVGWRILRWVLRMPLWGDEVMLALNFLDRSGIELLEPLAMGQVAPPLFMLLHSWWMQVAGYSEWILRLPSLLFGIVGLLLFSWFAMSSVRSSQALIAVGILAVSFYAVRHGTEFKPYALDLAVSVGLLAVAQYFRIRSVSLRTTFSLLLATSLATFCSYPSVFISASIITSLIVEAALMRDKRRLLAVGITAGLSGSSFVLSYLFIISPQAQTISLLQGIWQHSFPPSGLFAFVGWVIEQSAGRMMAYPVGDQNYGSVLTLTLVCIGITHLLRHRLWFLIGILVLPFIFNISAAALHLYPYGQRTGFAQHLVPSICLLAGIGINSLVSLAKGKYKCHAYRWVLRLLVIVGIFGIAEVIARPYKSHGDLIPRYVIEKNIPDFGCANLFVVNPLELVPVNFRWYLSIKENTQFGLNNFVDGLKSSDILCVLHFDADRYEGESALLNKAVIKQRKEMQLVSDKTEIAYIYGGKVHPHTFRLLVLKP